MAENQEIAKIDLNKVKPPVLEISEQPNFSGIFYGCNHGTFL